MNPGQRFFLTLLWLAFFMILALLLAAWAWVGAFVNAIECLKAPELSTLALMWVIVKFGLWKFLSIVCFVVAKAPLKD